MSEPMFYRMGWLIVGALTTLGCGGSSQTPPAKEPSSEATPEATSETAGSESAKPSEADPKEAPAPDKTSGGGAKKSCTELDKSTCKVTVGCVWNDVKKCVQETADDQ